MTSSDDAILEISVNIGKLQEQHTSMAQSMKVINHEMGGVEKQLIELNFKVQSIEKYISEKKEDSKWKDRAIITSCISLGIASLSVVLKVLIG